MRNQSEKTNAVQLYHQDGKPTGVYYCSVCRGTRPNEESAAECCAPRHCKDCKSLLEERWQTSCYPCSRARANQREQDAWDAVEKVSVEEATEMVYVDGDGSISPLDDVLGGVDDGEYEDGGAHLHVYCCVEEKLQLDAENILDHALENWFEGSYDHIGSYAVRDLQTLLDKWCEGRLTQWVQNPKLGVRIT